ncbi:MAG: hypothetical protein WCK11_00585 [Candidatus Falkowbacteria bacterium]
MGYLGSEQQTDKQHNHYKGEITMKSFGVPIIGVMIDSITELPQCREGLAILDAAEKQGNIKFGGLFVNSIHRNTMTVINNLIMHTAPKGAITRWIVAAGKANHLTGTCDAYLRYAMGSQVPVFGAVFTNEEDPDESLLAGILSIIQVPGHQVIFDPDNPTFEHACREALVATELLPFIKARPPKEAIEFETIGEAKKFIINSMH